MRKLVTASVAASLATVVALTLTGCGSGGSSDSASGSADTSAAQTYLDEHLANPTTIGIDAPLSRKPDAGKVVVGLNSGIPSAQVLADYWKKGAEDLGWTYKEINSGATPAEQQKAMESAIQLSPNGILTTGIPVSTIQTQLDDAQRKGIWVNTSASSDAPVGAMFDTSIAGTEQLKEWGKMIAADVVVKSGGAAKIAQFNLPAFPILGEFDKSFTASIKQWCNGCEVSENPQQAEDIGTNTPAAVVSALQQAPNTNWLVFSLAELNTGVDSALAAAGISNINIGGLSALPANYEALKQGTQNAWTAYPLPIVAYRQIDSMARKFNGDPGVQALLPTQVATPDNVDNLVFDSAGNYIAIADFEKQFHTLWKVS